MTTTFNDEIDHISFHLLNKAAIIRIKRIES